MAKSISKNIGFKFLLNLFNIIVPIIIGPYIYRKLGPDLNGYITFADSIYQYFFIFASFGIYQYGLREISKARDNKEKLEKTFTSLFTITIVTNTLSTLAYVLFISSRYSGDAFYGTCLITTFNFLSNAFYVEWVNEGIENYDFITKKTIVVRLLYTIAIFLIVKSSDNYIQYLYLVMGANFLNNFISFIYIKSKVKFNFHKLTIIRHLKPMLLVVFLSNANVLYTQLDKFMLGEIVSMEAVSFYGLAQKIMSIISTLMLTVIHVTIPRLSNYLANDDDEKYITLLDRITNIYFIFVFPVAMGIFLLSNEIVALYGGAEFISAGPVLAIFAIYMITVSYENVISNQIMYIKGKEATQVKIIFLGGAINLILNILLVKANIFTPHTAIITTTIANAVLIIGEYIYIKLTMNLNINLFGMSKLKYLLISLLFIPITLFLKATISNEFIYIGSVVTINALVYGCVLLIIKDTVILQGLDFVKGKLGK